MLLSAKTCVSYWLFHCNYQTLDTQLNLGWDPGKEKQTLHLPSKSGASLSPMAIVKLHGKCNVLTEIWNSVLIKIHSRKLGHILKLETCYSCI